MENKTDKQLKEMLKEIKAEMKKRGIIQECKYKTAFKKIQEVLT